MSSDAQAIELEQDDVRPIIPTGGTGKLGLIAFVLALGLGGFWIVSLMSEQRAALENEGAIEVVPDPKARISSPPPLNIPGAYTTDIAIAERRGLRPVVLQRTPSYSPPPVSEPAPIVRQVQSAPPSDNTLPIWSPTERSGSIASAVTFPSPSPPSPDASQKKVEDDKSMRVKAGRFENPSLTVPQGTVIPAVLETALDSTRPGGVRALVQRDIHSFDGSRVLIQRGSRLYGEYNAELRRGENRALIRWTRLIRPDGVTIALNSPASDPLGRAGVKGKVDGKFFQRFGNALLQSVLDIGVGVAVREASDGVIVALPGSTQNVVPNVAEGDLRPTLKVRHGTSVSVFVSRDLDFSSVE